MIIVLGGEKGGTGKTTIAVNLAVARAKQGRAVLLVDSDKQANASQWCAIRSQEKGDPPITCVAVFGDTLDDQVRALARRFDDVLIDTRGADAPELRSAMLAADRLITPIQASQFDLYTMGANDRLVAQARGFNRKLQAFALMNRATTHATSTDTEQAIEALRELASYQLMVAVLRERKAFRRCASEGRAVDELYPQDDKATHEMAQLAKEAWA